MLKRLHFESRDEWLAGRQAQGIGGSEAAAIVGMSPWMTPLDLWKLKLGITQPKDLSDSSAVQQGVRWEPILRDLFRRTHEEYIVEHHPFDILYQEERPWLFATLDGEIVERSTGFKGVLEIKTCTPSGKAGWAEWANGHMKDSYYVQCIHQLLATDYDFVILYAALFSLDGTLTIKPPYEIEKVDVEEDMKWLLEQEQAFYTKNILGGVMPSMPLTL